jgi:hypothetical protein
MELNLPYETITAKKWNSLGQTMRLSKALNMGWNSVRFRIKGQSFLCYRCTDGSYDLLSRGDGEDLLDAFDLSEKEALSLHIELADHFYEDSDGYPVVDAKVLQDDHNKKILKRA